MANKWTNEQQLAIDSKNSNILVAAAAGSGKTAVLVERIIKRIVDYKIDIDKLLVVTFTNAAASEMRQRVLDAIYKRLEENPNDLHLQKQIILMNKSNICTIHSFCLDVIKNNFFEIDVSPNFRIAGEEELDLLRRDCLEELFENLYEEKNEEFTKLIEIYTGYQSDDDLKNMVLKIYKFIQSSPFPEEWLENSVKEFDLKNKLESDFSNNKWGEILLREYREEIEDSINSTRLILNKVDKYIELSKYSLVLRDDIEQLEEALRTSKNWDSAFENSEKIKFKSWPVDKKITIDLKDSAKNARDIIKKKFMAKKKKILLYNSHSANQDISEMYEILEMLKNLIFKFSNMYSERKREKNIIDFNDIEHMALKILVTIGENGKKMPTEIAKKYREKFFEIAIDEYQDSNYVQEYILNSISKNNIFMVGDMKQSIYKFRQASPEIFLDKYERYNSITENIVDGLKIKLFKNFRSRENVLAVTNLIFDNIMSKRLGDIDYTEEEYLNVGRIFDTFNESEGKIFTKAELNIIDAKESDKTEIEELIQENEDNENQENNLEDKERIENANLEAIFVAQKIEEIINGNYYVFDKKQGYRKVEYRDIVILLRTTSNVAPIYEKILENKGFPVFSDSSKEYLDTIEIQTIISLLKIIDNPTNEIPLVAILRSQIGGFSDNEILEIRLIDKNINYYYALEKYQEFGENEEIKNKIKILLEKIKNWKNSTEYLGLDELIWKIYIDTGYYDYVGLMPGGDIRQANLKMLFERAKDYESASFKGLFNFIRFVEKLKSSSNDLDAAKLIGENENVIRIMSIHKSKGLEFPIVFLCGTGKKFNFQDLNENILLHQTIGLGPKYINYERRIEYTTAAKEAIRIKAKEEVIAEEMRILYVALTRATEKLIITGVSKDLEKEISKKQEALNVYESDSQKINSLLIKKYNSYLDLIELVSLKEEKKWNELVDVKYIKRDELIKNLKEDKKEEIDFIEGLNKLDDDYSEVEKLFNWKYKYESSTKLPSKTSVSNLKQILHNDENELIEYEDLINNKEKLIKIDVKPKFLNEKQELSNSEKGTLMHFVLQKLNYREEYNLEKLEELIQRMLANKIITKQEAEAINLNKILNFTKNEFYLRLQKAQKIYKEQAFYIEKEINTNNNIKEKILVQGIIDLFFIDENGKIVLVDYKTDFVNNDENELIQKYKVQIDLYKEALEKSFDKSIDECYIYSVYLNKFIKI